MFETSFEKKADERNLFHKLSLTKPFEMVLPFGTNQWARKETRGTVL